MKKEVDILEQKLQPHDTDTEWAVLADLMHDNTLLGQYGDIFDPSLFYYEKEKAMFRTIEGVISSGSITDINSLYNYTQTHELGYQLFKNDFLELLQMYNRQTIDQDIARLRDMGRRRTAWRMLQEAAQRTLDMTEDFDDTMASHLTGITELQSDTGASGIVTDTDTRKELIEGIDENMKGKTHGLRTGFKLFDDNYLLRPDTLTVIAAFTSVGKSALALNIVHSVARQGVACAYYSLEMSRKELVSRMVSKEADLTASAIINKPLTKEKADKAKGVIRSGMGLPIFYDDRATVDFNRTMRSIRTMAKTRDVKLAVIDYLQIYAQVKDDEERSISYMARTAKNVAKELGIAVVLISQLNRSALHPSIKMLRGSGQIEESADNIVLIDRPDAYPDNKVTHYEGEFKNASIKGTAKLILAKGRGVGTGSMLVGFDGTHTQFMEIEKPADAGHYEEQDEELPF